MSSTQPAREVSNSQALVEGMIATTVGGQVSYWVEYGETTAYSDETTHAQLNVPEGEGRAVAVTLEGLDPDTVYHFRLCSQDDEDGSAPGCSYDRAFRTGLACGTVLTQDTKLQANMICPTGSALVIGAPDITLDLAGHTVRSDYPFAGAAWIGIDNTAGHDGLILRNGSVRYDAEYDLGPGRAIDFEGASGGLIQNVQTLGDVQIDGDRNRLTGGQASAYAGTAVKFEGDDNQLLGYNVTSQETALAAAGARNRISDSFLGGYSAGARISGQDAVVLRSDVDGSPATGLSVTGSGHRIVDNQLSADWGWGLSIDGATNVVARENRINGGLDSPAALLVKRSAGTVLNLNRVIGTSPDGILVDSASSNTLLRFNHVSGLRDDGIDVDSATTSLSSNTANTNWDLGIEAVTGVTDLGGNLAAGNGNPLQCQNVFCQ